MADRRGPVPAHEILHGALMGHHGRIGGAAARILTATPESVNPPVGPVPSRVRYGGAWQPRDLRRQIPALIDGGGHLCAANYGPSRCEEGSNTCRDRIATKGTCVHPQPSPLSGGLAAGSCCGELREQTRRGDGAPVSERPAQAKIRALDRGPVRALQAGRTSSVGGRAARKSGHEDGSARDSSTR